MCATNYTVGLFEDAKTVLHQIDIKPNDNDVSNRMNDIDCGLLTPCYDTDLG